MQTERQYDLTEQRNFTVVKSNSLIQNSRYALSVQEQKIIWFLLMKIKPDDTELKEIAFPIKEFCNMCGIHNHSGGNYAYIKSTIQKLADKSIWIQTENNKRDVLIRWIAKAAIENGVVYIKLDDDLAPYLLQLREKFTEITVMYAFAMDCQYTMRVYELIKSFLYKDKVQTYSLEDFKYMLDVKKKPEKKGDEGKDKYKRFADFRRFVFDPAINEINELTDLNVEFQFNKEGRKFTSVTFFIRYKDTIPDLMETYAKVEKKLTPATQMEKFEQLQLEAVTRSTPS